ncbi:hypothetical protein K469DRAFT_683440 [Zopfia rhizophila CBS 207.26]|uniref:Tyrosine specific protein phosphatases domain-containing protein n=1 Tax=Zopfia rhizophila CBS 207.26 TaxID=1314779 RepID=A0A6A6DBR4_9PEZI|nr:hypothetical protein K469DRAFT_683440 [Zopfia rhizophila CBS 207.26]
MSTSKTITLPSPPFFSIPNISNLRDTALFPGGLRTSSGQKIRPGILFRSAEVSKLDRDGWAAIKSIGIGCVFDLRSKPEVGKGWGGVTGEGKAKEGDVRPGWIQMMEKEGVQRIWCPVFEETDYSPERLAERYLKYMDESVEGFVQAYHDILTHAGSAFRSILLYLASLPPPSTSLPNPKPLGALIHCTAGKDRTGIFFGLLFFFLGVAPSLIASEYQLTELGLLHTRDELVARLMQSPGFRKYMLSQLQGMKFSTAELADLIAKKGAHLGGDEEEGGEEPEIAMEVLEKGRAAALRMVGAKKESMERALGMIEREWGSAENYIRSVCGLGDSEIEALRRNLVVDDEGDEEVRRES